jgi:hypothetical protein
MADDRWWFSGWRSGGGRVHISVSKSGPHAKKCGEEARLWSEEEDRGGGGGGLPLLVI